MAKSVTYGEPQAALKRKYYTITVRLPEGVEDYIPKDVKLNGYFAQAIMEKLVEDGYASSINEIHKSTLNKMAARMLDARDSL